MEDAAKLHTNLPLSKFYSHPVPQKTGLQGESGELQVFYLPKRFSGNYLQNVILTIGLLHISSLINTLKKKNAEKFGSFIFISYFCHRHLQVAQLAWASEPIEFGSVFVSIYGKASSCALFLTVRNLENFTYRRNIATIDAHVAFIHDSMHRMRTIQKVCNLCAIVDYINKTAWVLRCLFNGIGIPEPRTVEQAVLGSTHFSLIGSPLLIK